MNLIEKSSPDVIELKEQIELLKAKQLLYLNGILQSGECDEQLMKMIKDNISFPFAIISSLKLSVEEEGFIMVNEYETNINYSNEIYSYIEDIFGKTKADMIYHYVSELDVQVNDFFGLSLTFPCKNNKSYSVSLFECKTVINDYVVSYVYDINKDYVFIADYLIAFMKKHEEEIWSDFATFYRGYISNMENGFKF